MDVIYQIVRSGGYSVICDLYYKTRREVRAIVKKIQPGENDAISPNIENLKNNSTQTIIMLFVFIIWKDFSLTMF